MDVATIRQRTFRNAVFGSAGFASTYVLRIGQAILLARLLTAEDYGLFAIIAMASTLGLAVGSGGFQAWLVQLPHEPSDREMTSGYYGQLALGILAAGLLLLATPLIMRQYDLPSAAGWALLLCALNTLMFATAAVPTVSMWRALRQDQTALINLLSAIAAIVVTLLMAWWGTGYWALLCGVLVQTTVSRLCILVLYPYRPRGFPSPTVLRSAMPVALSEQAAKLVPVLIDCWPPFVVGSVLGLEALGMVNWSRGIVGFLLAATTVLRTTYLPSLSRLRQSPHDFAEMLSQAIRTLNAGALVVLPLALFALPVMFEPLFSARWLPALSLTQLSLFANYAAALAALASVGVFAIGRSVDRLAISAMGVGVCWLLGTWMLHQLGVIAAPLTYLVIYGAEAVLCWTILWRHHFVTRTGTREAVTGIAQVVGVVTVSWLGGWALAAGADLPRDLTNLAAAMIAVAAVQWHSLRHGRVCALHLASLVLDRWRRHRTRPTAAEPAITPVQQAA